jgi:hypothetical protein
MGSLVCLVSGHHCDEQIFGTLGLASIRRTEVDHKRIRHRKKKTALSTAEKSKAGCSPAIAEFKGFDSKLMSHWAFQLLN